MFASVSAQSLDYHPYFNETSGTTLFDYSGNGFDGTLFGGITQGTDGPRTFNDDLAYSFDGSGDIVNATDQPEFSLLSSGNKGAVCTWIKVDSESDATNMLGVNSEWYVHPQDQTSGNGKVAPRFDTFGDNTLDEVSDTVAVGEWEHLCYNINAGSYIETWQNATLVGNTTDITDTSSDGADAGGDTYMSIGGIVDSDGSGDAYFGGDVDEARIYNGGLLSEQEIQNLYDHNQLSDVSSNTPPSFSNPEPLNGSENLETSLNISIKVSDSDNSTLEYVNLSWSNGTQFYSESSVSAGSTVQAEVSGLDNSTTYKWYAEASDGINISSTGNYSFTTDIEDKVVNSGIRDWYGLFNESGGDNLLDYSGNNLDGVLYGGVTQGVDGPKSFFDDLAYSFDGQDDAVNLSDADQFSILESGDSSAVSVWIKIDEEPSGDVQVANKADEWGIHPVDLSSGNSKVAPRFDTFGANTESAISETIPVGEWTHLTYNINAGSYIETWQDGELKFNTSISDTSANSATAMCVGANDNLSSSSKDCSIQHFPGDIDGFQIYNQMLDKEQINRVFNKDRAFQTYSDFNVRNEGIPVTDNPILNYSESTGNVNIRNGFFDSSNYVEIFPPKGAGDNPDVAGSTWRGQAGSITPLNSSHWVTSRRTRWPNDRGGNFTVAINTTKDLSNWSDQFTLKDDEINSPTNVSSFEGNDIRVYDGTIYLWFSYSRESGDWQTAYVTGNNLSEINSSLHDFSTWTQRFDSETKQEKDPRTHKINGSYYMTLGAEGYSDTWLIKSSTPDFSSYTIVDKNLFQRYADQFGSVGNGQSNAGVLMGNSSRFIYWHTVRDDYDGDGSEDDIVSYWLTSTDLDSWTLTNRQLIQGNWSTDNNQFRYFDYFDTPEGPVMISEWDHNNDGQNKSMILHDFRSLSTSDTTSPSISIDSPLNTTYSTSSVDLNVTSDEAVNFTRNVEYRNGSTVLSNKTYNENDQDLNVTLSNLPDGELTVNVWGNDSAGNVGKASQDFTVLTDTYVTINDSVQINQTSNNAFINVTKAFNVTNLTVYSDATNFGGINWTLNGDTSDRIDVKLSWFNDNNVDDTYLANYSVSTGVGTVVTSSFLPRPVDSVYQVYKNTEFFKQVQSDANKLLDFGYEETSDNYTDFSIKRTDNFRPEFNSTTYILDDVNNQERLEFVLWTRGQNDLASATGTGTRTEFTNTSLKYEVSLPVSSSYKITDAPGLSRTRNIDLSKSKSQITEDSTYSHNLSSQRRLQELNITNGEALPVNYTWNSSLGGDLTGQAQGNSKVSINDSSTGDFLNENKYPFKVESGEIVLGFNYTGWNQLEIENTVGNGFSGVSTQGVLSSISQCTRTNNSEVNVVGGSTENFTLGRTCNPGNKGSPTQDIVNVSDDTERVWYNSTDMVINTNYTENNSIVIRADKSNLKNPDERDGGSLKAYVEGVSSTSTDQLNVTDTGSYFRVKVGTSFQNSSLHTDDSDWSVTYTLSGDSTTIIGGGGGGGTQPTTEEQTVYFGEQQTQDGLETFNVPFNETSVRNLTITNPSQESLTAELVTGTNGVCQYITVRPTLESGQWSSSGSYDVPAASPNQLGTIQDAQVDTQIRFELPARSELESQGINDFTCDIDTRSSYGVPEPLVAEVEAPLSLGGILDALGLGQELCVTVPSASMDDNGEVVQDNREICQPLGVWLFAVAFLLILGYIGVQFARGKI